MENLEFRTTSEYRAKGRKLEGYAAKFGTEARIGPFVETIKPGAFRASLAANQDILALADHDMKSVLGRTRSGSLKLLEDGTGLSFSLDLPETQAGQDILALAERGDLGGMSFGFTVSKDGERWSGQTRELTAVTLHEISVVSAWPAYDGTEVALRSAFAGSDMAMRARQIKIWKMRAQTWA